MILRQEMQDWGLGCSHDLGQHDCEIPIRRSIRDRILTGNSQWLVCLHGGVKEELPGLMGSHFLRQIPQRFPQGFNPRPEIRHSTDRLCHRVIPLLESSPKEASDTMKEDHKGDMKWIRNPEEDPGGGDREHGW